MDENFFDGFNGNGWSAEIEMAAKLGDKIQLNKLNPRYCGTHFNGDSAPFSAIARMALSIDSWSLAQARSNSIKLCAHFDAISSRPLLKMVNQVEQYLILMMMSANPYPTSRVTEHPERNRCFISQVGRRMRLWWVRRALPRTSNSCSFVLVLRMRCRYSSLMRRDSAVNEAIDSSSKSGKPGDSA